MTYPIRLCFLQEPGSGHKTRYLLSYLLGIELQTAPLVPLRKCSHLVVLHISMLTPVTFSPLCGRNQALSVVFEAAFETCHCSRILHLTPQVQNFGEKLMN
jgi:hypothetical protein